MFLNEFSKDDNDRIPDLKAEKKELEQQLEKFNKRDDKWEKECIECEKIRKTKEVYKPKTEFSKCDPVKHPELCKAKVHKKAPKKTTEQKKKK